MASAMADSALPNHIATGVGLLNGLASTSTSVESHTSSNNSSNNHVSEQPSAPVDTASSVTTSETASASTASPTLSKESLSKATKASTSPSSNSKPNASSNNKSDSSNGASTTLLDALRARLSELTDLTAEEQEIQQEQETAMREAVREIAEIVTADAPELDKMEFVQNRFMELAQELSDTDLLLSRANRNLDMAMKDREAARAEVNKVVLMKTRLENLCRELQKENKRIKEESRLMIQSEQNKREELSAQFQKAITEIKEKMEDGEEKLRRAQDNEMMKDQLRNIVEQYNLREQHFNSILRSKDLEVKLYEAKLAQQTELAIQEHQKAMTYRQQHELSQQRESELRVQLETYADKFEQVQDAINKSNEVFNAFKREMEQMTKKLRKMEKENESLKGKCEAMNRNIFELLDEKTKTQKALDAYRVQKNKLESLSRVLQQERRELTARLERYTKRLEIAEGGPVVDISDGTELPHLDDEKLGVDVDVFELVDASVITPQSPTTTATIAALSTSSIPPQQQEQQQPSSPSSATATDEIDQ